MSWWGEEWIMSLKFYVNMGGHLNRTCHKGNIEAKECVECPDCLNINTILGVPKRVYCRGSGVEGLDRKNIQEWKK